MVIVQSTQCRLHSMGGSVQKSVIFSEFCVSWALLVSLMDCRSVQENSQQTRNLAVLVVPALYTLFIISVCGRGIYVSLTVRATAVSLPRYPLYLPKIAQNYHSVCKNGWELHKFAHYGLQNSVVLVNFCKNSVIFVIFSV